MEITAYVGYIAGAFVAIAMLPQLYRAWKTKHTKDISLIAFSLLSTGIGLWLVYGILIQDLPLIISNIFNFAFVFGVLLLKLRFG